MQVNRVQGIYNALSYVNNQRKSNSNHQNMNYGQTTNPLYGYKEALSFGMKQLSWASVVENIIPGNPEDKAMSCIKTLIIKSKEGNPNDIENFIGKINDDLFVKIMSFKNKLFKDKSINPYWGGTDNLFDYMVGNFPDTAKILLNRVNSLGNKEFHFTKFGQGETTHFMSTLPREFEWPQHELTSGLLNGALNGKNDFYLAADAQGRTNLMYASAYPLPKIIDQLCNDMETLDIKELKPIFEARDKTLKHLTPLGHLLNSKDFKAFHEDPDIIRIIKLAAKAVPEEVANIKFPKKIRTHGSFKDVIQIISESELDQADIAKFSKRNKKSNVLVDLLQDAFLSPFQ